MPARARDKVGAVSRSGRSAVTRAPHLERAIACALLAALIAACSHVSTVRVQEEAVEVGPGLRPVAAVQANAIRGYLLFIPIGPAADLDRVVNQLMVAAAKTMGADKVVLLDFDATPDGGVWALRKLLGWRSARASGVAVQVTSPAADPDQDLGPEPPPPGAPAAPPGADPPPAPPGADPTPAP